MRGLEQCQCSLASVFEQIGATLQSGHRCRFRSYYCILYADVNNEVDVVFDTAGGETLERSWSILKPGGRMVTIVPVTEDSDPRVKQAFFIVEPNQKELVEIGDLLDSGRLRVVVDAVVPLRQAPGAYYVKASRRHRGKVVVDVATTEKLPNREREDKYDSERKYATPGNRGRLEPGRRD